MDIRFVCSVNGSVENKKCHRLLTLMLKGHEKWALKSTQKQYKSIIKKIVHMLYSKSELVQ